MRLLLDRSRTIRSDFRSQEILAQALLERSSGLTGLRTGAVGGAKISFIASFKRSNPTGARPIVSSQKTLGLPLTRNKQKA